jgi:hypothetical protein
MTMNELAEEYLYAAHRITQQIVVLSECLRHTSVPHKQQALRSQLKTLRDIRREEQDLADLLLHYYERGGHYYEEYRV